MANKPNTSDFMRARIDYLEAENERLKEQVIKLLAYANAIMCEKEKCKWAKKR